MKFLLVAVNAKYIHSNPAIYSLRAYAGRELREHIELAEYTINQQMQEILADIYGRKPDVVGFSCYIWNWTMIKELLRELPKVLPHVGIWLGGPEVSYDAAELLWQFPQLSGVMVGEGEATFKEVLLRYVEREGKIGKAAETEAEAEAEAEICFADIPGLCIPMKNDEDVDAVTFLREGSIVSGEKCGENDGIIKGYFTAAREQVDLNSIPFPYDEDLDSFDNRIVYYESSRGCPFRCSYCLSSIDKRVRLRDFELVKKELQFFLDHGIKQVKFVDRTFNCDHGHAMNIWRYLLEHDNGVTNFHFEISADLLTEEELELLGKMRPGLVQLEIGVQSVNPRAIEAVCRRMDLEKLERNVVAIHRAGNIHQHLDLIAGLPYEDYESFKASFDRVYAMRPEQLQLGFLKVLKGSGMEEAAEEYGIRYLDMPPYEVLYTRWLSYDEVLRLKRVEEMVELYYNSGQFTHTLSFLEQAFESPFSMFEALAEFYEREGYFLQSPSRAYRYQVLFSFAEERDEEFADIYRELLTFDLYLRENLKSRPEFCGETFGDAEKDVVRAFYRAQEKEHSYLPEYVAYDWKQMSKMTHMELFACPVWDEEKMREYRKMRKSGDERCFILFDYLARSPLNREAGFKVITVREMEGFAGKYPDQNN